MNWNTAGVPGCCLLLDVVAVEMELLRSIDLDPDQHLVTLLHLDGLRTADRLTVLDPDLDGLRAWRFLGRHCLGRGGRSGAVVTGAEGCAGAGATGSVVAGGEGSAGAGAFSEVPELPQARQHDD